ncbi:DUF4402 domain-containing protein [Novosphingobium sp. Chol11]|uniref:DUF4402 domain-containing protein n=1 Tax=Novosphingobium sp. Chol11 TaxID=1385763 RepID=UPI0025FE8277|nr:DUF4402 domain-containing protein [Novosphingobium sp. Chol11]
MRYRSLIGLAGAALLVPAAQAAAPTISVRAEQDLRFGTFFTDTAGTRTVSATGAVTGTAIVPVGANTAGPAQFTITYDRGNNANRTYALQVQLIMTGVSLKVGGVTGVLSSFDTDLPGVGTLLPGQAAVFTINGCRRQICTQTFRVGGRLDVTRANGGAALALALPLTVVLIAEVPA